MQIHRTAHARNFTVLPNAVLQDRRLGFTARGLLADLLSRPDGWREDGRHMADTSTQGRGAIRKALKELTQAGYYRVDTVRMPDGTIRSEAHVYDTPQLGPPPGVPRPASGPATTGAAGTPVKDRYQEPSHPTEAEPADGPGQPGQPDQRDRPDGPDRRDRPDRREANPDSDRRPSAPPDEQTREAIATLFRVIRPEPRLRLGETEAKELAPLVTRWLQRGATTAELAQALLPGLPTPVHSPAGVLRHRLQHKLPPDRTPYQPSGQPRPRYAECATCHDPVPRPGICAACSGLGGRRATSGGEPGTAAVASAGAARVRAALRTARTTLLPRQPAGSGLTPSLRPA
ncbi:hypothetical protein AB0F71_18590 [Kitasatospora sp. NPDC028055]|uniref:hypothetical protein n=1 Tax=Kitasatospora sp. NPDC028055 TaxID=3155653 RepID=UPI0033E758AF